MAKIHCYPGAMKPTHHITLTDGTRTVGLIAVDQTGKANHRGISRTPVNRTAMKTTTGNPKWSDYEMPWTPVAQETFEGGMGMKDFDPDITRYKSAYRANTSIPGKVILGGQETYTTGYRNQELKLPGNVTWVTLIDGENHYIAQEFTASATYSAEYLYLLVRRRGTPETALTVQLCSNTAGDPGAALQTVTITTNGITDTISRLYISNITQALTSGTKYWIKIYTDGDADNYWQVGVNAAVGTTKHSSDGTTWDASSYDLYYRITGANSNTKLARTLFRYKNSIYLIENTSGAPKLYINGDRGAADSNAAALTTLIDATKTWVINEYAGCVAWVIEGPGSEEEEPYRVITSNTATVLTCASTWNIAHTTSTVYVIVASNKWTEIAGHGLTADITDVLVVNGIIYAAQGDATSIRRFRYYNNAGTWTAEYDDDGGATKATYFASVRSTDGAQVIWKANNSDAAALISVAKAPVVDWGTDLTFAAALAPKDDGGRITGLEEYDGKLLIYREGAICSATGTVVDLYDLAELATMRDCHNGTAHCRAGVYHYFNYAGGIESYYNGTMEDIGPNRDDGMPDNRKGKVSCLKSYPGRLFAAIDGGTSNYSSILMRCGGGWHDVYCAPEIGMRIFGKDAILPQAIPGSTVNRLWVVVGNDVIWLPLPSYSMDPTHDSAFRYTHEGVVEMGYIYSGMPDNQKYYQSAKIFADGLTTGQTIEIDYRVDDEEDWSTVEDAFDDSPMTEVLFLDKLGLMGKRIGMRLRIMTTNNTLTPSVKVAVVENLSRVPVKYSWSLLARVKENDVDLNGDAEELTMDEKMNLIDEWAENLTPLIMRCIHKRFDDKTVFLDPTPVIPLLANMDGEQAGDVETLTLVGR